MLSLGTVSCGATVPPVGPVLCPDTVASPGTVPLPDTVASHATVAPQGPVLTGDFIVIFAFPQAGILGGHGA